VGRDNSLIDEIIPTMHLKHQRQGKRGRKVEKLALTANAGWQRAVVHIARRYHTTQRVGWRGASYSWAQRAPLYVNPIDLGVGVVEVEETRRATHSFQAFELQRASCTLLAS